MLVGRERERSELAAAVAEARAGRGSLALIGGEAGIGKTTLVRDVLRGSGLAVFEGAALTPGAPAYWPLIVVLRAHARLGRAPPAADVASLLSECGAAPRRDQGAFLDTVVSAFLAVAAERPASVFLDDLQWADEGTIDLIAAIAPALGTEPLLVVGAYRSDEMPRGHPLRRLRTELRRHGRLHELAVEPLGESETAALLRAIVGADLAPSLLALLLDRTAGVPFFVEELGAALTSQDRLRSGRGGLELADGGELPLPENVRDAVLLRAAGLDEHILAALGVAAAIGPSFDPELASALAGLSEWPDEIARRGIVTEDATGHLSFRHDLVRDAFYGEIAWARRPALHRAIAQRLQDEGAPAAAVAEHWARGREPDRARSSFLTAADAFCAVHAYRDGARAIGRALELWPEGADEAARLQALEQLGTCAERAGDLSGAVRAWREAVEIRSAQDQPALLGKTLRSLAGALELQGRWEDALATRERAAGSFAAAARPADAAAERLAAAAHLRSAASFHAALALLETAHAEALDAQRPDLEARVLGLHGNVRARTGDGDVGLELVRAGLALALDHNLVGAAAEVYQRLADSLEHVGDYPAARETYDTAFGYCEANALAPTAQLCLACLTVVLRLAGEWNHAEALCREVLAAPASSLHARGAWCGTLGLILALRGQRRPARPLLLESATIARRIELAAMELLSGWGLAVLDHARAPAAGAERCHGILERWRETEERHYAISPLRWATTVFAEAKTATAVRACTAALAQIAADTGQDEAMSALAHALGEAALLEGEADEAASQFERATALLADLGAPFERAESQRRAAAALVACGRHDDAVQRLVAAHRAARRLGAAPLAARLADDLSKLGEPLERRLGRLAAAESEHGGLTRREVDVIRRIAAGQTDREIARALFLSPRTVETHVRHIKGKLDCRSRADTARRAAELGLVSEPGVTS